MEVEPDSRVCDLCHSHVLAKCFDIHTRACQKKNCKTNNLCEKLAMKNLIPCSECGQMIDFPVYSLHLDECVGRQLTKCPQCKLLYPTFLFEEHMGVCNTFNEQQQMAFNGSSYESDESIEDEDHEMNEMIMELAKNVQNEDEPLPLEVINCIPQIITSKCQECSICYVMISAKTNVLRMPCPHSFHVKCITAWLQKNPHCPMCRQHVIS